MRDLRDRYRHTFASTPLPFSLCLSRNDPVCNWRARRHKEYLKTRDILHIPYLYELRPMKEKQLVQSLLDSSKGRCRTGWLSDTPPTFCPSLLWSLNRGINKKTVNQNCTESSLLFYATHPDTLSCQFSHFSCSVVSDSLWPHGLQHDGLPCPSPGVWMCVLHTSIHIQAPPPVVSPNWKSQFSQLSNPLA